MREIHRTLLELTVFLSLMVLRCVAPSSLNMSALPALLDPILGIATGTVGCVEVLLDLSAATFVTPGGLATLAAVLEGVSDILPPVRLEAPADPLCRHYLASAGVLQMLRGLVTVRGADGLEGIQPGGDLDTVLPLTRLGGAEELQPLLQRLETKIDALLGRSDDAWNATKRPIISAVREICANVFQHAGGAPGWVMAQKYRPRQGRSPYLEIAIADAGLGIRATLTEQHVELRTASDGEVLARMVREHLSRHPDPGRGGGYYTLQKATHELDGQFRLRSGSGGVRRVRHSSQLDRRDGLPNWPGTHLEMRLTCS